MKFIFLVFSFSIIPSLSLVAKDEVRSAEEIPEQLKTLHAIMDAQQQRERLYDNMHGVWEIREQKEDGTVSEKTIEYWAREGKYFRVEWRPHAKNGAAVSATRVIIRPEGYVRLLIDSSTDIGTIIEIDEADKGMWRATDEHFYAQGNRTYDLPMWQIIRDKIEGTSSTEKFLLEETDGLVTLLTLFEKGENYQIVETVRFASDSKLVLGSSDNIEYDDGKIATNTLDYTYESISPQVPSSLKITFLPTHGKKSIETHTLKELQLEPAAMEAFDIDSSIFAPPTVGWSWPRRIMVMLIGLALIAAYFHWRRKANA
ncbi:hypothetical protein CA13_52440 [Planctomycetes bacterium CA13]|uniref:Uncharacterized protein n=1 Tax=Novipirellula herctigrandis TaxID=2527986 RepID=A0A5C5ZB41_9BACT|nr:hypothetical protein CA13_52440 [Planctomycetes bacterium CA13]